MRTLVKFLNEHRLSDAMLTLACYRTHQAIFFQHEHARCFIKRTGGNSPTVAAPRHRMNLRCVSREFFTFIVVFKAFLHLLVVLRRHVDAYVIFQRQERVLLYRRLLFRSGITTAALTPARCCQLTSALMKE